MIKRSHHVSAFMKRKREELKLSQKDLSATMGFNHPGGTQYISNTERGYCQFPVKHLPKLAAALNTDLGELKKLIISDYEVWIDHQMAGKKDETNTVA